MTHTLPTVNGSGIVGSQLKLNRIDPRDLIDSLQPGDELFLPDRWLVQVERHSLQDVLTHAALTCSITHDPFQQGYRLTRLPVPADVAARRQLGST